MKRSSKILWLYLLLSVNAHAAGDSVTVPAKSFSFLSPGGPVEGGWNLWSNGSGVCGFDFSASGTYTVVVGARGTSAEEQWPEMEVRLDDQKILDVPVDQTDWTPYSISVDAAAGHHEVSVHFTNDRVSSNEDRNLYLKYLTVISLDGFEIKGPQSPEEYTRRRDLLQSALLDQANERIAQLRKGDVHVSVVDADGNPVAGAEVTVRQLRHEFQFGTALASSMFSAGASEADTQRYLSEVKRLFNCAVPENAMKWPDVEPARKNLHYDALDRMVNWCGLNNIPLRGHCLVWECEKFLPDWVKKLSDADLKSALHERVRSVVARYKGRIHEFDVDNEMLHCNYLEQRLGSSARQDAFLDAHAANRNAVLYVNDYGIVEGGQLDEYVDQIRSLLSLGVPLGGIGVQLHLTGDVDLLELNRALDELARFNLPIKITEFSCAVDDENEQARILERVYRTVFAHAAVKGILTWGFWEKAQWRPKAAMLRTDFSQKPAAVMYEDLVFKQWWTRESGKTDADGNFTCSAFFGDYEIAVGTRRAEVKVSSKDGVAYVRIVDDGGAP